MIASPLAGLRDADCVYWIAMPRTGFAGLARRYVVLGPLAEQSACTGIPGFVTEETYREARAVADRHGWADADASEDAASLDALRAARFPAEGD